MHNFNLGSVEILWYGHASFRISDGRSFVYIDPFVLPDTFQKADVILVTHEHFDHCHIENIRRLQKDGTKIIGAESAIEKISAGQSIKPGHSTKVHGFKISAVEAYNVNKFREPGKPFHPKGLGIGFVLEADGKHIYHTGDTDKIEEMSLLQGIDAALMPIGGTYTMTAQEASEAALLFKPKSLIPMHFNSDKYGVSGINAHPLEVAKALVGKGVMVRILDPLV